MLIGTIVLASGASAIISIRPSVRRVCRKCGRAVIHSAAYVGYLYYPYQGVDWESVRYQRWLESHSDGE